jgi:ketosteroid isomerase-like protein
MATPAEIIEKVRHALESGNYKEFAACFHEDGIYERPYALKGTTHQYVGTHKIYNYIESSHRRLGHFSNMPNRCVPEKDPYTSRS